MANKAESAQDMFDSVSLGAPENAVGFVLWRVTVRYQREVDRVLASLDLTHLQFVTLTLSAWFERSGKLVTQTELATYGGIHPMQISYMLKTLALKGFVQRTQSATDSRAKHVTTTRAGMAVLRKALPEVVQVQHRMFGNEGKPGGDFLKALLRLDADLRDS